MKPRILDPRRIALVVAMVAVLAAGPAAAFSGGPPNGRTGAPGEITCTQCHNSFPLNSGDGSLSLAGIGDGYEPGQIYTLELTLADPLAQRWGFEFTVLGPTGDSLGNLAPLDGDVQISPSGSREYAKQTITGTSPGTTGSRSWQVQWTAPPVAGGGDATLYAAGTAANNNGSSSGDYVYNASFAIPEREPTAVEGIPVLARLLPNRPNPFNPRTVIAFDLARAGSVRLTLFTVDGSRVRTLVSGVRETGRHEVLWDGTDDTGRAVSSGTYLYRLETSFGSETRSMTLVR